MHGRPGIALWQIIVAIVVVVAGLTTLAAFLMVGVLKRAQEISNRTVCMSNLRSINMATMLYKSANDGAYPWLYDTMTGWDTTEVGAVRDINPFGTKDDPNNPKPRSITALMFLLVRQDQPPGMFRCPSDRNSRADYSTKAVRDDGDKASGVPAGEYYWDFSRPENVSYSWQAPIWKNGRFRQGIDNAETDTVVIADMTPAGANPQWKPANITQLTGSAIEAQNSPNHRGEQTNVLMVAGNVMGFKRPEVATGPRGNLKDNIYTAGGSDENDSQWQGSTSLDIRKHLSPRDTFLIGPVGRKAEAETK
jgi:hypothetical protein